MKRRVFLVVLDSFGMGALPDAAEYGDEGSNTLRSVSAQPEFDAPNLTKLGLFAIDGETKRAGEAPVGSYCRLAEQSKGKDTTTGHWEIAGLLSKRPFPTYPNGFPAEVIDRFSEMTGRGVLCNLPYSGTQVIADYGAEHMTTGKLIVYTSADSVFQIAAHEDVVPVEELYRYCRMARALLQGKHAVGRVIARPFIGEAGHFVRTSRRHDFSLEPSGETMLDRLKAAGKDVIGIGKISDIFAGRGLTESLGVNEDNADGMRKLALCMERDFDGLCFCNLVDFDAKYGHRNDAKGYAEAITAFDKGLGELLPKLGAGDLFMITADHGCDPLTPSTDHSREYVPLLIADGRGRNLGTRESFADISATILSAFGLPVLAGRALEVV